MDGRNVVLTGFMGTGKSTVGPLLAVRLGYAFVDTDELIVAGHGPIDVIFAERGEGTFRQLEREVAEHLAGRERLVISTGGRLMLDAVNAERLGATGHVVCLTASIDTILERVRDEAASRPLLAGDDVEGRVAGLLAERADAYARFTQVPTDELAPTAVVDEIVRLVSTADDPAS